MASYFDLPPQAAAPAVPKEELDEYKGSSLLSPQVSRILDDLDFDDESSSDDDNDNDNENDKDQGGKNSPVAIKPSDLAGTKPRSNSGTRKSRLGVELAPEEALPTAQATPEKETKEAKVSASRVTGKAKSSKPRHAHMERFKSLRSVLFLSNIEDNMNRARHEEQSREDAAMAWKAQHEKRQGFNRPSTPEKANEKVNEKENDPSQKEPLSSRMAMKIRRITSHSTPMAQIPEGNQEPREPAPTRRDSTATDTDEELAPQQSNTWRPRADSETSIDHSDIDELVRWVSRRDPPSDGEVSLPPSSPRNAASQDKDTKSLAPSDIPQLVQHASRLSIPTTSTVQFHPDSDASTASDDEAESEEEDPEELMRWVSRREGSMAGPVPGRGAAVAEKGDGDDSDVPEIGSWRARRSQEGTEDVRGRTMERSSGEGSRERKGLTEEDVDELVRWVSRRDSKGGGETVVREKGIVV